MQTNFSLAQLSNPHIKDANEILRACVHCGFCNATCPTYSLLGDELDGPRGRIYLIKEMLEGSRPASETDVKHLDRCLSCLSCMTTCPAGVNYLHLVDHGRRHIEETYKRKFIDRLTRGLLGVVLPSKKLFRLALLLATISRVFGPLLPKQYQKMLRLVSNTKIQNKVLTSKIYTASGTPKYRVGILTGCVQDHLASNINHSTIRLLNRHGCDVVLLSGVDCCGAINLHLGQGELALKHIKANIQAWLDSDKLKKLDAIIINMSGCGATVKDYGHILRCDVEFTKSAAKISDLAVDISEFIDRIGLKNPQLSKQIRVAYQSPCSLQHGQRVRSEPVTLLNACGFEVVLPKNEHICCGAAGTYNILEYEISEELGTKKLRSLRECSPDVIASGNFGCIMQLKNEMAGVNPFPIVHTVELLDWATGGPPPLSMNKNLGNLL